MHTDILKQTFVHVASLILLAGLVSSISCGELPDGGGSGGDDGEGDVTRNAYPSCYGKAEGELLENLVFLQPDETPVSMNDFYQDPSNKVMLVSTSASWCGACIEEQPALQAMYDRFGDQGLVVLVALFEDAQFNPATPELAGDWRERYELNGVDVVADPDFLFEDYYDASLTPMNMIVDLSTMTIVYIETGWDPSQVEATVRSLL
ncbi:MAG: TlpA disulfide reductase family protein [Myxococcota bacterium]